MTAHDPDAIAFDDPAGTEQLAFTGERYVPGVGGAIRSEHLHRYLFAARFCRGRRVLDVACGEGYGTRLLSRMAAHVTGVDVDPGTIRHALGRYGDPRTEFRQGEAVALPLQDASVDVVVSFETIEHFTEHDGFLAELRRVLRPDGLVVLSSPDKSTFMRDAPTPNRFHQKELERSELAALLAAHFQHVRLLEQQFLVGSVITLQDAGATAERLYSRDGTAFHRGVPAEHALYTIALASDAALPDVGSSVMHDSTDLLRIEREFREAAAEVTRLQRDLALARAETAYLKRRIQTQSDT